MKTEVKHAGFVRTEWAIVAIILSLLTSFLLRFLNIWIKSVRLAEAANMVAALPVILIGALLLALLVFRLFSKRCAGRKSRKDIKTDEEAK